MEPTQALAVLEVGLRNLIIERLGEDWLDLPGAPTRESLEKRRASEQRKRHAAVVSEELLAYTMTPDLGTVIFANWDASESVFPDRVRLEALFGIVQDVRNTVAHSRDLLPFERELLSGVAGYVSNSLAAHRSSLEGSGTYYPIIETLVDQQGNSGIAPPYGTVTGNRLAVGDVILLRGTSTPTRGLELIWKLQVGKGYAGVTTYSQTLTEVRGDAVTLEHQVREEDVAEDFWVRVFLTTESKFHRNTQYAFEPYDDLAQITYPVKPPFGM